MKITKLGHCCLLIEYKQKRILTDPGIFLDKNLKIENIDYIFITHEHQDHIHINTLKKILDNNKAAKVICNKSVKNIIISNNIAVTIVEMENGSIDFGYGENRFEIHTRTIPHAHIYSTVEPVDNTSLRIDKIFYYPGDTFHPPDTAVKALAVPVCAPWLTIEKAIKFAIMSAPEIAFPVHDGFLSHDLPMNPFVDFTGKILMTHNIGWYGLKNGESIEIK